MALRPMSVPSPAFFGLARQRQQSPLGPEWAVKAKNVVVDANGRLSSRKGWTPLNASPYGGGAAVTQIHEYVKTNGTTEIISTVPTDIFTGTSSPTSIKGALSPTAGNWKFINFNGFVLGWQASHTPIAYNGTGTFAVITPASGTLPDGSTALAAFGRVWGLDDDKQTIRYSALLDHTRWATADGGGSIDMRQVWTKGMDEVMAIISFGSSLVVFGKRHIVMWVDGAGSEIGLSPTNMYVNQVIENVGLVARDAVTLVGEIDVAFWSSSGVRSLARTVQEQATPVNELSPSNRDLLASALTTGNLTKVRMAYSAIDGFVLLVHPDYGRTFCFDARQRTPDNGYRMTDWTLAPTAVATTLTEAIYFGFPGDIAQYIGYDDDGAGYQFEYESGWIDVKDEEQRKQAMKALKAFMFSVGSNVVTFKWWVDFKPASNTLQREVGTGSADEWGVMQWAIGEWGSGQAFHEKRIPLSKEAEYFKFAIIVNIDGGQFAVQPVTIYSRPTRVA